MRILTLLIIATMTFACRNEKKKDDTPVVAEKKSLKKSAAQYQKEFQLSLGKGDTIEAIRVLERYHKIDSNDAESRGALILLLVQSRQMPRVEGLAKLQKLYDQSRTPALENMYVSFVMYNGTPSQIIAGLDTLIAHYPDRSVFHTRRAYTLLEMGRYDDAIQSFTNAMKLEPDNLYLRADRTLATYRKGETKTACMAWKTPGGGAQSYFEQYCKWPEFEEAWNTFVRNPGNETAQPVQILLSKHYESMEPPAEKLSTHILNTWMKLSGKTPGNETILDIGFDLLKLMKDDRHYALRCELAKSIIIAPKTFLIQVRNNRDRFDDLNGLVGAFGKELINDKATQLKETEKRIVALNSVNATDLIRTRGECLLALEKKRERLMHP